jgi:CAAX protease family protein
MQQLTKAQIVLYHFYPGLIITAGFILFGPIAIKNGFPPQAGMLVAILLFGIPALLIHLYKKRKEERRNNISDLNGLTNKLPLWKLIVYCLILLVIAYTIWGITQPVNKVITDHLFNWLPGWYTVQDFKGYSMDALKVTLILNLLINGIAAPLAEEFYFRGYLLPRMNAFGKSAFIVNTILFSFYHFWQPQVYLTILLALLPMIYLVWKTKSLQLATLTHCLLNGIGALLSFGLLVK